MEEADPTGELRTEWEKLSQQYRNYYSSFRQYGWGGAVGFMDVMRVLNKRDMLREQMVQAKKDAGKRRIQVARGGTDVQVAALTEAAQQAQQAAQQAQQAAPLAQQAAGQTVTIAGGLGAAIRKERVEADLTVEQLVVRDLPFQMVETQARSRRLVTQGAASG